MTRFSAQARIEMADAERVIAAVCDHMIEHQGRLERQGDAHILHFPNASARFHRDAGQTLIDVSAADLEGIYYVRMAIASHIAEFAGEAAPDIVWDGDGSDLARPPNFQILQIEAITNLTPYMRRLTLSGPDVVRFCPMDALHLNILVQQPGLAAPQWPSVGADGLIAWAEPDKRPAFRKYTVRAVDVAAGTLDIDFVRHADAGPGSDFAETARIGDRIGVAGPGGGGLAEADWYLFAGDETALPAIARMLECLPETASGQAFIEVADAAEIQTIRSRSNVEITWLTRDGRPAGTTALLPDAIAATLFPVAGTSIYVWAGCEFEAFQTIRAHLRRQRGLKKHEHLAVSYWRRGASG